MAAVDIVVRIVRIVVGVAVSLLLLGLFLRVAGANESQAIVDAIVSTAEALAGPFDDVFELDDPDVELAANWGLAAAVWLVAGALVVAVLRALGRTASRR